MARPAESPLARLLVHTYGWQHYRRLTRADGLSEEDLHRRQSSKLARLLRHAFAAVPYYRDMVETGRIRPDGQAPSELLRDLPVLTKADIAANFPDRILSNGRRTLGSRHLASTGTTSDRIDIVLDLSSQDRRHGAELWADDLGGGCPLGARRLEIPPDACSRECGANRHRPGGFLDEVRWAGAQSGSPVAALVGVTGRRLRRSVRQAIMNDRTLPPFGPDGTCIPGETVQQYVDEIRRERPYLLSGLPTYLHQIGRYLQRTGQSAPVPVVRPIGSLTTRLLKQYLADCFHAEVYETYGSNELGGMAVECHRHQWLHVAVVSHVVEVLRDGRPAEEGELGHIVVTCLDNFAMPLIRYKLGDVGRWHKGPCECGRRTQLIECNGRLQDLIVTAGGRPVTEEQVMDLMYFTLGLEHFQLVERRRGQFDLMIVAAPGEEADLNHIRSAVGALLDNPRHLAIFPVETVYPEATGKFRFVKSVSYEDFG